MAELPGAVAPEETVVDTVVTETTPAPESTADQATETQEQPAAVAPEKPELSESEKAFQKRLGIESRRLQRTLRAEMEAEFYKRELEQTRRSAAPPQATGEPDPNKFKDFDSYNAALISHRVEQAVAARMTARDEESSAQQQARLDAQRDESLRQKLAEAEAKHGPEFREAIADPDLPFNGAILAYIGDSKIGGDVALHLANNRTEATRIAGLSPIQQVIALHAIETKLSAPPRTTTAPAPIVPSAPRPSTEKKLEEVETQEEFNAIRRRQIAARKGIWK